ncbi:type II secretion system protein [bacterium]|jgi:prepilin-type N-terminal cleavage/methylation domain-containing protein|nr:type II secretion system protein [bacterium]
MNKIKTYGFSLIEIMAALAILSIGMSSIMAVFPAGMESFRKARDNTVLANLMRSKVSELTYELGSPIGRGDNASRIAKYYLKADTAFARYMSEDDKSKRASSPVMVSEVYPFEQNPRYFWQYTVHDIGREGDTKIGEKGVKGVFFQIEMNVYDRSQIQEELVPLDHSRVKEDQVNKPILRQIFRVHNPYPAITYGKNAKK